MRKLILALTLWAFILVVFAAGIGVAGAADLEVDNPSYATTEATQLSLAYYLFEELRLEHNAKGQDFKDGKITRAEWEAYLKETFDPRTDALATFVNKAKSDAAKTAFHALQGVTLDNAFKVR